MKISARGLVIGIVVWLGRAQVHCIAEPAVSGELKQWHKITLTLEGPQVAETENAPTPFLDYRVAVTFTHESGTPVYKVPGYFAADGDAGNSSAAAGEQLR